MSLLAWIFIAILHPMRKPPELLEARRRLSHCLLKSRCELVRGNEHTSQLRVEP